MGTTGGKTHIATKAITGLGAGWSDPVPMYGLGRGGELVELTFRGDVGDATTAATAEFILFAAELPAGTSRGPARTTPPTSVPVADFDPDDIIDAHVFAEITAITVTAHATDKSHSVNFRDPAVAAGAALYGLPSTKYHLWVAVKAVTGIVHVGFKAKGD